jgi:hypothetical protein
MGWGFPMSKKETDKRNENMMSLLDHENGVIIRPPQCDFQARR